MLTSLVLMAVKPMTFKPSPARMKATIEKLCTWNTRNTNTPELEEAAAWVADQFKQIPGLQVETWHYTIHADGKRVPVDKEVPEIIAVLPGETDTRVMVSGHIDSINLHDDIYKGRAPGANDDGSGLALTLESAHLMAQHKWHNTLVFVGVTGEEQGLFGSTALAARAKAEKWKISGYLNNDTVGSSMKPDGEINRNWVRVFSTATTDTNSRELARLTEFQNRDNSVKVKLIFRPDRFGRGGDHTPFNQQGFTAVRFTELYERYDHQHTPLDTIDYVDFDYLAAVTRANLTTLASLANAAAPPTEVRVKRVLDDNVTLSWHALPGVKYEVYWRDTTDAGWKEKIPVGEANGFVMEGASKDDSVFAVAAEGGIPVEAK